MSAPMKNKQYGLLIPQKNKKAAVVQKKSIFGDESDDEEPVSVKTVNKNIQKQTLLKKKTQLDIEQALTEDPNIFDYDGVYDSMVEEKKAKDVRLLNKQDSRPKYIGHLLKMAEVRKKEDERRTERKVQKEREQEQGKFADKEAFVTGAYKKKMQEMQEEEEKERRKAEMEERLDVTKQKDLSGFYRHIYKQTLGDDSVKKEVKEEKKDSPTRRRDDSSSSSGSSSSSSSSESDSDRKSSVKVKRERSSSPRDRRRRSLSTERRRDKSRDGGSYGERREREREERRSRDRDRDSGRSRDRKEEGFRERRRSKERGDRREREQRGSRERERRRSRDRYDDRNRDRKDRTRREGDASDKKEVDVKEEKKNVEKVVKNAKRPAEDGESEDQLLSKLAKKTVADKMDDAKMRYLMRKQGKKAVVEDDSD